MSTSSWSFVAAGLLILFAIAGFGIGYFLNRNPSKSNKTEESED